MIGTFTLLMCLSCSVDTGVDPVLSEVRSLSIKVERLEGKVDAVHDSIVSLTATIKAKEQLINEDHTTITNPNTGLTVRMTKVESSQARHSWVLYTIAGVVTTIVGGVGVAAWKKRLGLNGKKRTS